MAVVEVQRAIGDGASSISATLAAAPTPGNLLIALLCGAPTGGAVAGWSVNNPGATTADDGYIYARPVQTGDGKTFSFPLAGGWDTELLLTELSGASGAISYVAGDAAIAANSVTSLALSASAGSLAYILFGLFCYAVVPTVGADTLSNSFTRLDSRTSSLSAGFNSYFVLGSRSFASSGPTASTLTAPNFSGNAGLPASPISIVIASGVLGVISIGNGPNPGGTIASGAFAGGNIGNNAT